MVLAHTFWKKGQGALPIPHHVWLFQKERLGGQLHKHTTHLLDLARYLVGEVKRVYAIGSVVASHDEIEGYATTDVDGVHLEFEHGAIGLIGAMHITPRAYWWGLHILADTVILEVDRSGVKSMREETVEEYRPIPPGNNQHFYEDTVFIEAVRRGDRSLIRSGYSDALRSAAISLAANESMETGRVIDIDLFLSR